MIKWFKRRKERKFIKDAFHLTNVFWPYFSMAQADELLLHLSTLLVEYENAYGKDGFIEFYRGRLDYFRIVGKHKL